MKFTVVILVVLIKDAFGASAEANSLPLLRKFSRNKDELADASAELEARGLFSIYKPTKRPTSANVIFISSPSGPAADSEESENTTPSPPSSPSEPSWPSWPSWPYWPIHPTQTPSTTSTTTTTTTTPKPTTKPHPHHPSGEYPHYLPFLPPLLLPIPGWTGNPPPPFIPPHYQHRPQPDWQQPPFSDFEFASAPGTPTFAADDIINADEPEDEDEDEDEDENEEEDDLIWVPLPPNFNVDAPGQEGVIKITPQVIASLAGAKREPTPTRRPRPVRRRTTTQKPIPVEELTVNKRRKPRPTKRQRPIKKPTTEGPKEDQPPQKQPANRKKPKPSRKPRPKPSEKPAQITEILDSANAVEVSSEKPKKPIVAIMKPVEASSQSPSRRKPLPNKKTRPSRKPAPTTRAPAVVVSSTKRVRNRPAVEAPSKLDEPLQDDSGAAEGEQLANVEPQPTPKPELVNAGEPDKSEQQLPVSPTTDDMEVVVAVKPEPVEEDLNSSEFLGPDKDLIVVQRKGKPMEIQQTEGGQVPPWQLLKLPRDSDWERGPEQRDARPKYVFYG